MAVDISSLLKTKAKLCLSFLFTFLLTEKIGNGSSFSLIGEIKRSPKPY